jgi:hypothetical protein
MSFKSLVAAAAAVAALSVAAPAAALTLTFKIDVTGSSDGSPLPASFTETWTFNPVFSSSSFSFPGFPPFVMPSTTTTDRFGGAAVASDGALTGDLLTLAGLSGVAPTASTATFKNRRVYDGDNNLTSQNTEAEFNLTVNSNALVSGGGTPEDVFDDIYDISSYSRYLFLAEGNYSPPAMTEAAFIDFLVGQGPLSWNEQASHTVGSPYFGGQIVSSESRGYSGTATLVTGPGGAVPEPASWALMILGFGAAGAMLRRRSLATA